MSLFNSLLESSLIRFSLPRAHLILNFFLFCANLISCFLISKFVFVCINLSWGPILFQTMIVVRKETETRKGGDVLALVITRNGLAAGIAAENEGKEAARQGKYFCFRCSCSQLSVTVALPFQSPTV